VLCNAHIYHADFEKTLSSARAGDVAYLDCPYWPVSTTANFRGYTSSGFGPDEQVRLRDVALRLKKKGVSVVLSNADVPPVRELYKKGFKIERVEMARSINSDGGKRGKVGELLIY
jgi:DNA adenine methylase